MNKLSKEKRKQLVFVALGTLGVLAGIWLGLIRAQQRSLGTIALAREDAQRKLQRMETDVRNIGQLASDLADATNHLAALERGMASGDLYNWVIDAVREFRLKLPYKVEIPEFSPIDGPRDVSLFPSFPYKQASLTVRGSALFHDFGRFLADFENQFPHIRVQNLTLEPVAGAFGADKEKLAFRMDIVMLVKPGS